VTANGYNYWLTKHGRRRFLERVESTASDTEILQTAINGKEGYKFIWAPDKRYPDFGRRLVTVLIQHSTAPKCANERSLSWLC